MNASRTPNCAECLDRRDFVRLLGGVAALATGVGTSRLLGDTPATPAAPRPAEAIIQELFGTLTADQKQNILLPYDHGGRNPTRLGMYNSPIQNKDLGTVYTKAQQELIEKILRAVLAGDEGFKRVARNGTWDNGKGFLGCGAHFFGEPGSDKPYAWVFTGHHLTIRADGNFQDGLAWGGPVYYGHSANGHADTNVYNYQTRSLTTVFRSLDAGQQKKAIAVKNPGDGTIAFQIQKPRHGIATEDLNNEQRALVEKVMRDLLLPFRKEDADEAMGIVKTNGGLEKIHLAFYRDADATDGERWHWWRLEGPGFVWNYRVLPHVHCRVEIKKV
jgi:hypothetical protein